MICMEFNMPGVSQGLKCRSLSFLLSFCIAGLPADLENLENLEKPGNRKGDLENLEKGFNLPANLENSHKNLEKMFSVSTAVR